MYDPTSIHNTDVVSEGTLDSLYDEMAAEPSSGLWPVAWYAATIIEGFATRNGEQRLTGNFISKDAQSINLYISVEVKNAKGEIRNIRTNLNYRPQDLDPAYVKQVNDARKEFAGVQKWPAKDLQRSSLAIASIGQFKKATGAPLVVAGGQIDPAPFIGKSVDVHLTQKANDNGQTFNEINEFAPAGSKSGARK